MLAPKHPDEEARLAALHRYGILDSDEDQAAFDEIIRLAAELCDAPIAVINLIDRDRQWFKSELGLGVRETPLDISICAHIFLQPGVTVVPDTREDTRFADNPLVTGDPLLRFYAGAVLEANDGHALGTLCVLDYKPRTLTPQQENVLRVLAREVMARIELRLLVRQQAEAMGQAQQMDGEARALEARFRAIQETSPDGFMVLESVRDDTDGPITDFRWVYVNEAAARIVGRPRDSFVGRRLLTEMPGNKEDGLFDQYVRVVETGESWHAEFSYQHEGVDVFLRTSAAKVEDGFAVSFADLSERRRAELALAESEARYRTLVSSIDEGFCLIEVLFTADNQPYDYRFVEVNPAFERQTGLVDAVGKTIAELVPGIDGSWSRIYGEIALTGEAKRFDNHDPAMGRWFDVYALRVGDANDRRVAILFNNISDRVLTEKALRESEERNRNILESITDAFFAVDHDWRYTYLNRQTEILLGRTRDDLLGKELWTEYPGLSGTEFEAAYRGAAEQRIAASVTQFYPDHDRWYEVNAYPAPDGVTAYFRDVTERMRHEEALREAAAKNERIAETLQRSMLVAPPPDRFPGLELATDYEAAWDEAQVGGDFYDTFALAGGRVALVVGDATGKGLEAAAHTAEVKYALRAYLRENADPAEALGRLNRFLMQSQHLDATGGSNEEASEMACVALALAVVDTATGEGICSCAGSEPPLLVRASAEGLAEEVEAFGQLLGAGDEGEYVSTPFVMETGDLLVMTTDGITEARSLTNRRHFFGLSGVVDSVQESLRGPIGLEKVATGVTGRAKAFAGGKLRDDVCLLIARYTG